MKANGCKERNKEKVSISTQTEKFTKEFFKMEFVKV